jgi:hypothetical protein
MTGTEFVMAMTLMSSGIGLVFFFAVPVRKAMLRKIEGSAHAHDPALDGEVEDLRARLGELEERLDFAERLLARQRDAAELPPGGLR